MRIPVYNAEGSVTREAPGRSIRSRMDATPFIQAELRKGEVLGAAAQAAGEYANARYKVQVENDLNEAMLGAQETLRTRRDELAKSPNYNRVLDGDDPLWNRETTQIKNELRKKVGKNVYALSQFDNRFGQLELQNRFALRNDIDRKIASVAAANRAQQLIDGENTIANSPNLADIDFTIAGVKLNGDRLVQLGLGKGENLSKQEYAMVLRGTKRALDNLVNSSDSAVLTVHEIHKALRDESTDAPEGEGVSPEGQKVYHLLRSLNNADQVKLLKSAGATSTYIDGPTIFEKNQRLITAEIGKQAEGTLNQFIQDTEIGEIPSDADVDALQVQLNAAKQSQTPAEYAELAAKVEYFNTVKVAAAEMKEMNGNDLREEIKKRETVEDKTRTQIDVLQFMRGRLNALDTAVENDPLPWANTNGVVTLNDVDYGNFITQDGQPNPEFIEALQKRMAQSLEVQGVYQRTSLALAPVIMTKAETAQVSRMLNEMGPEQDLAFISSVQAALGPDASRLLFAQLGDEAPFMSFVAGLHASGFGQQAANDIFAGLQFEDQVKISSIRGDANEGVNFDFIMADVFIGFPDTYQASLQPSIKRSVEAILTYQLKNGEINIDEDGGFTQEDLRKIVSYVMGGSKDGETGGIGILDDPDSENPIYYHRPDGINDEQFVTALKDNLADVFPDGAEKINETLNKNYAISMVGQTDPGREPIYQLLATDGEALNNPLTTEAVGVGDDPYQFTYSMLVGVGVAKELAAEQSAAEELAAKQARNPEIELDNVDPTLLAKAQADLAVEQDALQEASNAQPVGSVGGQVVKGQSTGITGGATDAEIEQLMGTDNAPEVATAQDDEEFDQIIEGNKYKGEMKNGKRNGAGVLIRKDGTIAEGNFKNNMFDGAIVLRKPNGKLIIKGNYNEGTLIDDEELEISANTLFLANEIFDIKYDKSLRRINVNKNRAIGHLQKYNPREFAWVTSNKVLKILLDRLDLKE